MTTSVRKSRTEVHDAPKPRYYVPTYHRTTPTGAGPFPFGHITWRATKPRFCSREQNRGQSRVECRRVDGMLSRGVRPRCANWIEMSEDVPTCGYSPGSTRRAACVDIFPSAHHGPWGLCFRNRLALLRPAACRSRRGPGAPGFRATGEQSAAPKDSPPGSHDRPPDLAR